MNPPLGELLDARGIVRCAAQLARLWRCDVTQVTVTTQPAPGGFEGIAAGPCGRLLVARGHATRDRAVAHLTPSNFAAGTLACLAPDDALEGIERALLGVLVQAEGTDLQAAVRRALEAVVHARECHDTGRAG